MASSKGTLAAELPGSDIVPVQGDIIDDAAITRIAAPSSRPTSVRPWASSACTRRAYAG